MQGIRHITVAVDDNLYRQTRRLAADHDTTVTDMVRFLLLVMPEALKDARYNGGRPQFALAAERSAEAGTPWPPPVGTTIHRAAPGPDEPDLDEPDLDHTAPAGMAIPPDQRAPRAPRRSKYDLARYDLTPRF